MGLQREVRVCDPEYHHQGAIQPWPEEDRPEDSPGQGPGQDVCPPVPQERVDENEIKKSIDMETTLVDSVKSATASIKEFERGIAQVAKATEGLNEALLREYKALQRRRLHRIVVYTSLLLMMVALWFCPAHLAWKIGLDVALAFIIFCILALDNPRGDMSPDERILQGELERREK